MEDKGMSTNNEKSWVEVFSGAAFETEVVKGLLESHAIPCILENHTMSAVTSPYSGIGGDMRILVAPSSKDEALALIATTGATK